MAVSGFQARREAGFGQRGNGKVNGRGVSVKLSRAAPTRTSLICTFDQFERLSHSPDAGSAVHSINLQLQFRHWLPLFV